MHIQRFAGELHLSLVINRKGRRSSKGEGQGERKPTLVLLESSVWCSEERPKDHSCANLKPAGVMHQIVLHRRDPS